MSDADAKRSILIQLDADAHASAFDRVVAIDAGVDEVFSYSGVKLEDVEPLVHGAIFTRGPKDLHRTAVFIGGSDVAAGEAMLKRVRGAFFGPLRVSVMLDANGANTTAAAAVLAAGRHVDISGGQALVLAGTGPVGQRAARLLAGQGATVRLASRSADRAAEAAASVNAAVGAQRVTPCATGDRAGIEQALAGVALVIAAGKAGVQLLPADVWQSAKGLKAIIDLNAVPPAGIEGVEVTDKARDRHGVIAYGAIGVGGTKMKIHKAAIVALFQANDRVLDAEAIYEMGKGL